MSHKSPSWYSRVAQRRAVIERKTAKRASVESSPAGWDMMTEAQRQAWRDEQQEIENNRIDSPNWITGC